jgi:DNA invertase Pin-like site-specific DNA recombinase
MDIAIYCRISTDKQDNQNQLDQFRALAASQGWNVRREYVDVATGTQAEINCERSFLDVPVEVLKDTVKVDKAAPID